MIDRAELKRAIREAIAEDREARGGSQVGQVPIPTGEFLTPMEAAQLARVGARQIIKWRRDGSLKTVGTPRRPLIVRAELVSLLSRQPTKTEGAPDIGQRAKALMKL
jgi:crotonobetainyl-CoA:carnitine CoA-transferase CaiB-like acyl-CoA transferase